MAMGKKKAPIEYSTEVRDGVYVPISPGSGPSKPHSGQKNRKNRPESHRNVQAPGKIVPSHMIPIGTIDTRYLKAEILINRNAIPPMLFGLSALGMILVQLANRRK